MEANSSIAIQDAASSHKTLDIAKLDVKGCLNKYTLRHIYKDYQIYKTAAVGRLRITHACRSSAYALL